MINKRGMYAKHQKTTFSDAKGIGSLQSLKRQFLSCPEHYRYYFYHVLDVDEVFPIETNQIHVACYYPKRDNMSLKPFEEIPIEVFSTYSLESIVSLQFEEEEPAKLIRLSDDMKTKIAIEEVFSINNDCSLHKTISNNLYNKMFLEEPIKPWSYVLFSCIIVFIATLMWHTRSYVSYNELFFPFWGILLAIANYLISSRDERGETML